LGRSPPFAEACEAVLREQLLELGQLAPRPPQRLPAWPSCGDDDAFLEPQQQQVQV